MPVLSLSPTELRAEAEAHRATAVRRLAEGDAAAAEQFIALARSAESEARAAENGPQR